MNAMRARMSSALLYPKPAFLRLQLMSRHRSLFSKGGVEEVLLLATISARPRRPCRSRYFAGCTVFEHFLLAPASEQEAAKDRAQKPDRAERMAGFFSGESGASGPTRDFPSLFFAYSPRARSRAFRSFSAPPFRLLLFQHGYPFLASAAILLSVGVAALPEEGPQDHRQVAGGYHGTGEHHRTSTRIYAVIAWLEDTADIQNDVLHFSYHAQ